MISVSTAYAAAAAKLNKVPIFVFQIEDYSRSFSNADTSSLPFLSSPPSGTLTKFASHSTAGVHGPDLIYDFSPAGAYAAPGGDSGLVKPRSQIDKVYAVVHATAIMGIAVGLISGPWSPGYAVDVSVDGGTTYTGIIPGGTDLHTSGGDFSLDITSLIGSIASFDFTQVKVRVTQDSGTLVYGSSTAAELDISGLALLITYTGSGDSYLMAFNDAAATTAWTIGTWPPGAADGSDYGSAAFTPSSLSGTFTTDPWIVGIDDQQLTVNDLDGGADLADLVVHVQDRDHLITADFPGFVFEGKKARLLQGWGHIDPDSESPVSDLGFADFATLFTGQLYSVESENANNDYCFSVSDLSSVLSKVIYVTGDDGFATDSTNVRTLNGHPLDILLSALETEVGMAAADIDVATITTYRDTVYSGAQMQFTIDSPPVAKDFIESEILKPMGAYRYTNNLGQFSIAFFYPLSTATVFDFTEDNIVGIPDAGQADLINQVSTRFDASAGSGSTFLAESIEQDSVSVAKYGMYGSLVIESKGLRSGLNGFFFSAITAFLIFLRYAYKALLHGDNGTNTASNPVTAIWSAALLDPGDFVTLTHSKVPDRVTGTMGVTLKTYVVMDRLWQFFIGNVQYKLLAIDLSKFKQYLITGDGEADYVSASAGDKAKYLFLCGDDDKYSNGDAGNTLC